MAEPRSCTFCIHMRWDNVSPGCETCGNMNGGLGCNKGRFYERLPWGESEFREVMLTAVSCEDYEQWRPDEGEE